MQRFIAYSISFLLGSVLLSALSMIQKIAVGYDPLFLEGYIMSVLSGGIIGIIIGHYFFKVKMLNKALLERVNTLESFLPICANCKKIRKPGSDPKDKQSWEAVEAYITHRINSKFSHGICPDCVEILYGEFNEKH